MKRSPLLIDAACGALVGEQALARALQEGLSAGAGFGLLIWEPPVEGSPLLSLRPPNFTLTRQVAWASDAAMQFMVDQLIDNIEALGGGQPTNLLT